jgi:hypothetical protein
MSTLNEHQIEKLQKFSAMYKSNYESDRPFFERICYIIHKILPVKDQFYNDYIRYFGDTWGRLFSIITSSLYWIEKAASKKYQGHWDFITTPDYILSSQLLGLFYINKSLDKINDNFMYKKLVKTFPIIGFLNTDNGLNLLSKSFTVLTGLYNPSTSRANMKKWPVCLANFKIMFDKAYNEKKWKELIEYCKSLIVRSL